MSKRAKKSGTRRRRAPKRVALKAATVAPQMARLAVAVQLAAGDEPPTEFRLFQRGWNDTEKGRFLFDDAAAKATMAAAKAHDVDRMIDLEHLSLDDQAPNYDPDARGAFRLDLRDGDLWAVAATWTADGAARLREKRQRYTSPAFLFDPKTRRVTKLVNVAITSMPATHGCMPLVAANTQGTAMNSEQKKKAIEAIKSGDSAAALEMLEAMVVDEMPEAEAPTVEASDADAEEKKPPAELADDSDDEDDDEDASEVAATTARLLRLTDRKTFSAALSEAETWRQSHIALKADREKLAREREVLERKERATLYAAMVKLGAEIPATIRPDGNTVCERLANEPIESLRARVNAMAETKGKTLATLTASADVTPPTVTTVGGVALTADEKAICKEMGCTEENYAAMRAI